MSEPISIISNPANDQRERNAYRFSVGSAILFVVIISLTFLVNRSFTSGIASTITLGVCVVASIFSAILSRRGMSTAGVLIMLSSLIFLNTVQIFIVKGFAISSGIINIIVVTTIAIYTLPRKWIARVVTIVFIASTLSIFVDQFIQGVPASDSPEFANIIAISIGVIYLFILLLQFPRLTLRAKLIVGFIALTAFPIIILGTQTYLSTRNLLEDQVRGEILRTAQSTNSDIEAFAKNQFNAMQIQARSSDIINFISLPSTTRAGSEEERLAIETLKSFRKNNPTSIQGYAILDLTGKSIIDTNANTLGVDYSDRDFYKYVTSNQEIYASGLATVPGESNFVIYFVVPVISQSGDMVGMYLRTYNASVIQAVMDQLIRTDRATRRTSQFSYIMDGTNMFVLAHSARVDLLYKTYLSKDDERIPALIVNGLIDSEKFDSRLISQSETVTELGQMGDTASFLLPSPASQYAPSESAATRVNNTNWIVITSEPSSTITELIQGQTRVTVVLSLILMALAALIALFAASFFTNPITELTQIAQSISAGDFKKKATIRTRDEIGLLADSINVMSEEIQQSIEKLESRVERRTADLSLATQQSEKRAQNLQTIAEISRTIATEKDQEKLLSLITQIVSDKFGFYHVGIFLLDDNRAYAVLRATNSVGGEEMLKRKHSLKVGQTGIVGYVASTGMPRIALDTGADAVFFNNPSLPETHSEMALPLITRGTVIGALDVQSKVPNAFTDADVSTLSLLADQVAIAIDNSRLLEAAQASIEETRAVFSEYLAEAWHKKTESGVVGYRQTTSGGQILTNANMSVLTTSNNGHGKPLEVPIRIRDQTIGVLNIRATSDSQDWSDDEMNVIEAVAERLGLALDNARLFEETSTRATRERLVADITTKIRGTNDPQEMIKTALEELKQVLGASKVEILPSKINLSSDH